jgi:hypothetical protein
MTEEEIVRIEKRYEAQRWDLTVVIGHVRWIREIAPGLLGFADSLDSIAGDGEHAQIAQTVALGLRSLFDDIMGKSMTMRDAKAQS